MTKDVVTFDPDDSLGKATRLFEQYKYDGFPVINKEGKLLGIVTAYDMVSQSYATHLPSVINILENMGNNSNGGDNLKAQFSRIGEIKIRDMMNEDPLVIGADVRIEDLAKEFLEHHRVNPIPVINSEKKLLGVVSRFDIVRFFDAEYLQKILIKSGHEEILNRLENT